MSLLDHHRHLKIPLAHRRYRDIKIAATRTVVMLALLLVLTLIALPMAR